VSQISNNMVVPPNDKEVSLDRRHGAEEHPSEYQGAKPAASTGRGMPGHQQSFRAPFNTVPSGEIMIPRGTFGDMEGTRAFTT